MSLLSFLLIAFWHSSCQNVCDALSYSDEMLCRTIYIIYGTKLYRQIVGIPMGKSYAPLVADLFLF